MKLLLDEIVGLLEKGVDTLDADMSTVRLEELRELVHHALFQAGEQSGHEESGGLLERLDNACQTLCTQLREFEFTSSESVYAAAQCRRTTERIRRFFIYLLEDRRKSFAFQKGAVTNDWEEYNRLNIV